MSGAKPTEGRQSLMFVGCFEHLDGCPTGAHGGLQMLLRDSSGNWMGWPAREGDPLWLKLKDEVAQRELAEGELSAAT